ncbi:hypothetical protein JYT72_00195 [Crocinitomix catalasitica]|nr:hypothetical protein [Crocinitomix catalasitica]
MKKTIFLLTALSMIQVSCRKDEINPSAKPGSNWLLIDVSDGLPSNMVADIFIDDNDRVTVACHHVTVSQVWVPPVTSSGTGYYTNKFTYKTSIADLSDMGVKDIIDFTDYAGLATETQKVGFDFYGRLYVAVNDSNRMLIHDNGNWTSLKIGIQKAQTFTELVTDANGIWFGCGAPGLMHIDQNNVLETIPVTNPIGIPNHVSDLTISDGKVFYFCSNSLNICEDGSVTNIASANNSGGFVCTDKQGSFWSLTDKDGSAGYGNYLNKYSTTGNQLEEYWLDISYPAFQDLVIDLDGNFWISVRTTDPLNIHQNGIYKFDGVNITHFTPGNSDLPSSNVGDLEVDASGNIWIATEAAGVAIYKNL